MTMREAREAKKWTRAELARRARMHAATVGQIESGRLRPYPRQLEKLSRALGLSAADLQMGWSDGDAVA